MRFEKLERKIKSSSNLINDCKGYEEIEENNISEGEGGLSSFKCIINDNDILTKQKNKNINSNNTFISEQVILLGPKFINYLDYSYSKDSFKIIKHFSKIII